MPVIPSSILISVIGTKFVVSSAVSAVYHGAMLAFSAFGAVGEVKSTIAPEPEMVRV